MPTATATKRHKKNFVALTVLFKPDELQKIEALASDEVRSKSSMARLLVAEALEARVAHSAS